MESRRCVCNCCTSSCKCVEEPESKMRGTDVSSPPCSQLSGSQHPSLRFTTLDSRRGSASSRTSHPRHTTTSWCACCAFQTRTRRTWCGTKGSRDVNRTWLCPESRQDSVPDTKTVTSTMGKGGKQGITHQMMVAVRHAMDQVEIRRRIRSSAVNVVEEATVRLGCCGSDVDRYVRTNRWECRKRENRLCGTK